MEESKPSVLKSTLNYGAMLGLALVMYTLLLWMLDATQNRVLGLVSIPITIVGIILATRAFRDNEQAGYISYGRALGIGTLTAMFASLITSVFTILLYTIIDPGLLDKTHAIMEEAYYQSGLGDDQIEIAMQMAKRFTIPPVMALTGFLGGTFFGFVYSLITSIFLRKEADPFDTEFVENE